MRASFPLRWKILACFFLNLLVAAGILLLFLRIQFRVGINSLLAGSAGERLEAIAEPLALQLQQLPEARWASALETATTAWRKQGVRTALFRNNGRFIAGDAEELPAEVRKTIFEHDVRRGDLHAPTAGQHPAPPPGAPQGPGPAQGPGGPGDHDGPGGPGSLTTSGGPGGPGGPPSGPNGGPGQPPLHEPKLVTPFQKFILTTSSPRTYWAGVFLGEIYAAKPGGDPPTLSLIFASSSLSGGGLFFDYKPWLAFVIALVLVSTLLWLPFMHRLTSELLRMTGVAEKIAQGKFDPPRPNRRSDELGRLSRSIHEMAIRLEGFTKGQKRFLGDTAHELLSPLARLELSLSILEQHHAGDGAPYVQKALGEVRLMSELVQNLLSFSKAGLQERNIQLQPVPLRELVLDVAAIEAESADLQVEIPDSLCALGDYQLLFRAVANVVRNSLRYAGKEGLLRIAAHISPSRTTHLELTLSDEGPGVPPDSLDHLFDPFYRPETARTRETGGTGLGLAIVKSCIEACDGEVSVENVTPKGLRITFRLGRA